jgi:hypothetical protein
MAVGSVGQTDCDRLALPADATFLEVGRVPDQAVGTQRISHIVARRGFAHRSAPDAGNGGVASEAHAANSLAFPQFRQCLHLPTTRAGGPDHCRRACGDEFVDEPQHRWDGCVATRSRQQVGPLDHRPRQSSLTCRSDRRRVQRRCDDVRIECRIVAADQVDQFSYGTACGVGTIRASRFAVAVSAGDPTSLTATSADSGLIHAR